jgi:hypothetical protein
MSAPSDANFSAMARPIPRAEPVTMATRPSIEQKVETDITHSFGGGGIYKLLYRNRYNP